MPRASRLAAVAALALAGAAASPARPAPPPATEGDEAAARELLLRAGEKAADGRYSRAVREYEEVVRKYPDTEAGRLALLRTQPNAYLGHVDLLRHGPSSNRVDVVVMGDGYELHQLDAFDDIANDVPHEFQRYDVFEEYFTYFNFVRMALVSAEDGIDAHGREYDTVLGGRLVGLEIGHAAVEADLARRYLEELPEHDGLVIAYVKQGAFGTAQGKVATIGGRQERTLIHEWSHALGGLADEYTDTVFSRHALYHVSPNVTDSEDRIPWSHWLEERGAGIGVYEGAAGRVSGYWKPATECLMNIDDRAYCRVCREALVLAIYSYVDGIESCDPPAMDVASSESLTPGSAPDSPGRPDDLRFEVVVMDPASKSHELEVTWWVLPEAAAPRTSGLPLDHTRRAMRGPLPPIEHEPQAAKHSKTHRAGDQLQHVFELDPADFEPGRYRVVCRARDTTELRGDRFPWVLRDDAGLLESERAWWVRIDG